MVLKQWNTIKTNEWDIKKYKIYSLKKKALGSLVLQSSTWFETVIVEIGTIKERFPTLCWSNGKDALLARSNPAKRPEII